MYIVDTEITINMQNWRFYMVDIKYANAYNEVLEILKYIPEEDYN